MKKTIIFTLAIAVAILFAGCGQKGGSSKEILFNYADSQVMDSMVNEAAFTFEAEDDQELRVYLQIYKGYEQIKELKTDIIDKGESTLYFKIDRGDETTYTLEGTEFSANTTTEDLLSGMSGARAYISRSSDVSGGRAMIMVINMNEEEMAGDVLNFVEDSNFEGVLNTNENDVSIVLSVGLNINN